MKWKSVSPDVKRRDSPKFKRQEQHYDYYNKLNYSTEPIELVAIRFQEIERHEREMARIREFERIQFERNYEQFRSPFEYENTQSYRGYNYEPPLNYGHPIRNNLFYSNVIENENYERENYQQQISPIKRHWIKDDEEEDELYFYGGGRKKKTGQMGQLQAPEKHVYNESSSKLKAEDFEYNPVDFETSSTDVPTSSWSTDSESDYERTAKKKNLKIKPKLQDNSNSNEAKEIYISGVKPKAYAPKIIDLDAPIIIKLPPNPIPNTWAHIVHNPLNAIQKQLPSTTEILTKSISDRKWLEGLKLRNPVQGILMRPPFDEETFNIKDWAKFMQKILPNVMPDGYLFIWIEREELADVIRVAEKYLSFKYVENLCWIRRDVGNRLMREASTSSEKPALFYKSKMTLLILRRDPNNRCKLRHQRNPDCIFDFVGPGRMPNGRVYDVIETLLDGTKLSGPHLMHLWAGNSPTDRLVYQSRRQWIRVLEVDDPEELDNNSKEKMKEDIEETANKADIAIATDNEIIETVAVVPESEVIEPFVTEPEVGDTVITEAIPLTVVETDVSTEIKDLVSSATADDLETELNDTDHQNYINNQIHEVIDSNENLKFIETIVNETLKDLNHNQNECKISGLYLSSSTFDEDFCNFITCDPLSNC